MVGRSAGVVMGGCAPAATGAGLGDACSATAAESLGLLLFLLLLPDLRVLLTAATAGRRRRDRREPESVFLRLAICKRQRRTERTREEWQR